MKKKLKFIGKHFYLKDRFKNGAWEAANLNAFRKFRGFLKIVYF